MAGDTGFEPVSDGVKVRCLTAWRIPKVFGAGEENRTLTTSLEGWGSTIELHPHIWMSTTPNHCYYESE